MAKNMTLDQIIQKNPGISVDEVNKGVALAEELKRMGVQRKEYELAAPFLRRRPVTGVDESVDPRTINLSASRK